MFQVFNFLLSFQLVLKFCCENNFLCSCKYFLIFAIWTRDVECFTVRKFILVLHNLQQVHLNSSTQFPSLTLFEKKIQFIFREHLALQGTFRVPTQPTLVWSWAVAHAETTTGGEFQLQACNFGTVDVQLSLCCSGSFVWHDVVMTSFCEESDTCDKPPW